MPLSLLYLILIIAIILLPRSYQKNASIIGTGALFIYTLYFLSDTSKLFYAFDISSFQFSITNLPIKQKVFTLMFSLTAFIGNIFLLDKRKSIERLACLFYVTSALGVLDSSDLISFFIFFELLTVGAVLSLIEKDYRASLYYLLFHAVSGLLFLIGLIFHYNTYQNISLSTQSLSSLSGIFIFLALGINVGFPLLSSWITETYYKASSGGILFMSALTTKVTIYAFLVFFPGLSILIPIGLIMSIVPLFYAFFESDVRKMLSYSLINPLGFMLVSIGSDSSQGVLAAKAHVLSHISYKSLLFIVAGMVLHAYGSVDAKKIGSIRKVEPKLFYLGILGALLVVFPGSSAFVSKKLIMGSVGGGYVYSILFFSSILLSIVSSIRFIDLLFFGEAKENSKLREINPSWYLALFIPVLFLLAFGVKPSLFNSILVSKIRVFDIYSLKVFIKYILIYGLLTYLYIVARKFGLLKRAYSYNFSLESDIFSKIFSYLKHGGVRLSEYSNRKTFSFFAKILKNFYNLKSNMHPVFTVSRTLTFLVLVILLLFLNSF